MNFQGQTVSSKEGKSLTKLSCFFDVSFFCWAETPLFVMSFSARMKTIWGMKFSFALRTAFAALLASIYAMHPEVFWTEIMKQDDQPFLPVFVSFCIVCCCLSVVFLAS